MSKKQKKTKNSSDTKGYRLLKKYKSITAFELENGLRILYMHLPGTGVITSNITLRISLICAV